MGSSFADRGGGLGMLSILVSSISCSFRGEMAKIKNRLTGLGNPGSGAGVNDFVIHVYI